jgi:hypothetical protein
VTDLEARRVDQQIEAARRTSRRHRRGDRGAITEVDLVVVGRTTRIWV